MSSGRIPRVSMNALHACLGLRVVAGDEDVGSALLQDELIAAHDLDGVAARYCGLGDWWARMLRYRVFQAGWPQLVTFSDENRVQGSAVSR
jgi:hypothetical protein